MIIYEYTQPGWIPKFSGSNPHFSALNCRAAMTLGPLDCDLISPRRIKARCQSETRWQTLNLKALMDVGRSKISRVQSIHEHQLQ